MNRKQILSLNSNLRPYYQRVKSIVGNSLIAYWPLWDASGSIATDISGNGRNGAYVTTTLANDQSLAHKPRPLFTTSVVNLYSASFNTAFMAAAALRGFITLVFKVSVEGVWSDGTPRYALDLTSTTATCLVRIQRTNANNNFAITFVCGGVTSTCTFVIKNTGDVHVGVTWDHTIATIKYFMNGALIKTLTGLGIWADTNLLSGWTHIGSHADNGSAGPWHGWINDVVIGNIYLTNAQAKNLAKLSVPAKTIALLGDSLTAIGVINPDMYYDILMRGFNKGVCGVVNHAVGNSKIIDNMSDQVTAAAIDNADLIVIVLGTNDTETGAPLTTKYQECLVTLKSSNPNARIVGVGIFDRTDMSGVADKNARISDACSNAGITYKDPTGVISPATDTVDGTHWNAGGHAKVGAWMLSWA